MEGVTAPTAEARVKKAPVGTSLGRVKRAVDADLVQEACVALDSLLAARPTRLTSSYE